MDKFFPFLIGLIIVAFQIYNNFRKEQEKARKRNPAAPPPAVPKDSTNSAEKPVLKPQTILVEEVFDPVHPYEPQYKPVYKEPTVPKVTPEPKYEKIKPEAVIKERINPEVLAEEEKRSQSIHQLHPHGFQAYREVEEINPYTDFDLRDAVIKEAILNRPQI